MAADAALSDNSPASVEQLRVRPKPLSRCLLPPTFAVASSARRRAYAVHQGPEGTRHRLPRPIPSDR